MTAISSEERMPCHTAVSAGWGQEPRMSSELVACDNLPRCNVPGGQAGEGERDLCPFTSFLCVSGGPEVVPTGL